MGVGSSRSSSTRNHTRPALSAARAIGRTIQNIHRQSSEPRMNPDRVGPIAGATAITMEMVPII